MISLKNKIERLPFYRDSVCLCDNRGTKSWYAFEKHRLRLVQIFLNCVVETLIANMRHGKNYKSNGRRITSKYVDGGTKSNCAAFKKLHDGE